MIDNYDKFLNNSRPPRSHSELNDSSDIYKDRLVNLDNFQDSQYKNQYNSGF